jgi:hypothetical protein
MMVEGEGKVVALGGKSHKVPSRKRGGDVTVGKRCKKEPEKKSKGGQDSKSTKGKSGGKRLKKREPRGKGVMMVMTTMAPTRIVVHKIHVMIMTTCPPAMTTTSL